MHTRACRFVGNSDGPVTGPDTVVVHDQVPPGDVLDGCVAVYQHAFGEPPYGESRRDAEGLRDRVARYAARDGFLLPVATGADGRPVGFALGVTAHPGDWWRDSGPTG